ncbi:MAG: T9SS type A sorting domain-containing protein [Candidatus Levyibacteriota bacterium]
MASQKKKSKQKLHFIVIVFLLLLSVPLTLALVARPQETRSHASAGSTVLSLKGPGYSPSLQKNVGDAVDLDLYVDPGTDIVSFVKYQVTFDPNKLQLKTVQPVEINQTNFSNVEGPIVSPNTVAQSLSIGADPSHIIRTKTKVVTLHFTAIGNTSGVPTTVTFGSNTQALSAGSAYSAGTNVLSSTIPTSIVISGSGSGYDTASGSATPGNLTLLLDGVGSAGDNPNPTGNSLSNKTPLHPQRTVNVQIFNTNNQLVSSTSASVTYTSTSGTFDGSLDLSSLAPGQYIFKVQTDRYLRKQVPGILKIPANKPLPTTALIAGDANGDNVLNILDYNALLDCGYGQINPLPNTDPASPFQTSTCQVHTPADNVDFDDNGIVNSADYNLFLRELSVQNGD